MRLQTHPVSPTNRLPYAQLLAFMVAGFLTIMTETMPAGLLTQIGPGLGVSEAMAGQLVTLYALGSVLVAIPVIVATRSWNRRPLFVMAMAGLLIFNTITALSTNYILTLVARFIAGMAAGLVWGLMAGYIRRLVPAHLLGRSMAIAGVGQPIALCIGVPLGTWLGTMLDWRGVFWIMSALALILVVWVRLALPDFAGQSADQSMPIRRVGMIPGIRSVLWTLLIWILAHNLLYTYIAPFLTSVGLGERVDAVLLLFGVCAIAGIWVTGLLVDRWLRVLTLLSLAVFAIAALVLGLSGGSPVAVLAGIAAWGLTFGGGPTLLQTALTATAGEQADVAQSLFVTVFNLAVAGGGLTGGMLLQHVGPSALPWILAVLAVLALIIAMSARRHGFKSRRQAAWV